MCTQCAVPLSGRRRRRFYLVWLSDLYVVVCRCRVAPESHRLSVLSRRRSMYEGSTAYTRPTDNRETETQHHSPHTSIYKSLCMW